MKSAAYHWYSMDLKELKIDLAKQKIRIVFFIPEHHWGICTEEPGKMRTFKNQYFRVSYIFEGKFFSIIEIGIAPNPKNHS